MFATKALTLLMSAALVLAGVPGFGFQANPSMTPPVQGEQAREPQVVDEDVVGEDEGAAIQACQLLALAEERYKATLHSDHPESHYASRFASSQGKQDGLYSGPDSLIPAFLASAGGDGDTQDNPSKPYAGYYFRILTRQGKGARGGEQNYIADGQLTGGFAFVAYPAEYGASGVMTFIVNQDNIIYQKDLGSETPTIVASMTRYNPGPDWRRAK